MNVKVAVCDHFLNDFRKKLDDISIEESDKFGCICSNTLTHLILICNQCPGKICSCSINNQNDEHCCVTCTLNFLNSKMKKMCFSNEDCALALQIFPSTVSINN